MTPYFQDKTLTVFCGDAREVLREMADESVQCCVTSPPYFGLRNYNCDGQIGLEETPQAYVETMVEVFREVRRVLKDNGTVWLNLGDSYAGGGNNRGNGSPLFAKQASNQGATGQCANHAKNIRQIEGLKPKDLIGIPWQVAFALRADGWYLRSEIIWHKLNPMPESVTDRPTKAHEQVFLLAKSGRYFYNAEAIAESAVAPGVRLATPYTQLSVGSVTTTAYNGNAKETRNRRSVWSIATQPYSGAHFATYPCDLIEPCILAGCPEGGTVLDPFAGSGTTLQVAEKNGCKAIGIELNLDYCRLIEKRLRQQVLPMFAPETDAQPPAQKGNE